MTFEELQAEIVKLILAYEHEHNQLLGCFISDPTSSIEVRFHDYDGEKFSKQTYSIEAEKSV